MLITLFWILIALVFYSYFGYALILAFFAIFRNKQQAKKISDHELPEITLVVAAYNEKDIIAHKISNSNKLKYPTGKLHFLWVTDGSDDGSDILLESYPNIRVLHKPERDGKTAALNRAMEHISTPITVFSDCNTLLSPDTILKLAYALQPKDVGCVAGEKRIYKDPKDRAAGAGEGFYWSYESFVKKLESKVNSTIGAAGELFAIKTALYDAPPKDTIIDDFVISLKIAQKGYKIKYEPKASATELASSAIKEEMKRKVRIAAGSFQVLFRMPSLLNIFKHPMLSFQYLSHKVLRWLVVPIALFIIPAINLAIVLQKNEHVLYTYLLYVELSLLALSLLGNILQKKSLKLKVLFIPFYIYVMNISVIKGFFRFLKGNQSAAWEKVKRNTATNTQD